MFKPHYGTCLCHGKPRLIVVKAGYCKEGNENRKKKTDHGDRLPNEKGNYDGSGQIIFGSKISKQKKKKQIHYRRKRTGEGQVFQEMLERIREMGREGKSSCACCGRAIQEFRPGNFSHVLAKSTYPSLRLEPSNIWIVCLQCHHEWEFGDRNQLKFESKRQRAAELKLEYYQSKTNKLCS